MILPLVAIVCGAMSIVSMKAGKKGFGWLMGIVGFLTFIYWLKTGPGFALLDWGNNPSVNVPDNIPLPGGGK